MRVSVWAAAVAFGSLVGLGLGLGGCVDDCPLIRQHVFVVDTEPELQGSIDQCRASRLGGDQACAGTAPSSVIACDCLQLCRRLLGIIDQFPGDETLTGCDFSLVATVDAGSQSRAAEVVVTYRPSSCP